MKANELRIGNLVNVPREDQCPFRIDLFDFVSTGIGKFGMIYDKKAHPLTWYLQDLKSISLTEGWLLRFGYYKEKFSNDWQGKYHRISEFTSGVFTCDKTGVSLKSVHQLQNLYFALTGEELIITDDGTQKD